MGEAEKCPVPEAERPEDCPLPGRDRRLDDGWRAEMTSRVASLERGLTENTRTTNSVKDDVAAVKKNTDEIVEFFQAGKGFFAVASMVGKIAKWITTIAAAATLLWLALKTGVNGRDGGGAP